MSDTTPEEKAMVVEMFPESECTATDSPHVFIHKLPWTGYRVWFRVGVQYFRIGDIDYDDLDHAHWHARMFIKALSLLTCHRTGPEPGQS